MENKILFIGAMGAGKTTAIECLSDDPPVRTEARNSDPEGKKTTTVALDFGRIVLPGDHDVLLYGIPGQQRFDFVWSIVGKGAMGAILLVNCSESDWQANMRVFISQFDQLAQKGRMVVALNRSQVTDMMEAQNILIEANCVVPVILTDPRSREEMLTALELLIATVEMEGVVSGRAD